MPQITQPEYKFKLQRAASPKRIRYVSKQRNQTKRMEILSRSPPKDTWN